MLLHPTSLPGPAGIGGLGPAAAAFLDWLAAAGQSVWQMLPLGPTGLGNSPYGASSALAGNPLLISLRSLAEQDLLPAAALSEAPISSGPRVDYDTVRRYKESLLRSSWERVLGSSARAGVEERLERFTDASENRSWLPDWALYAALKRRFDGRPWSEWPRELRLRDPRALAAAREDLAEEIRYQLYLQMLFAEQWSDLRQTAAQRGVRLFGDLSFYVAYDSAEVWADRHLFDLDPEGRPLALSGVPPDGINPIGQHWGHPLYRWDRIAAEGYGWWIERLAAELRRFDLVRIDHFRGFSAYWRVPAGAATAAEGEWVEGPGRALFDAAVRALGDLPLVAEDLGFIDEAVRRLLRETGLPGMRVLQFGFDEAESEHRPDLYPRDCVAYTGTHDLDTAKGWFEALAGEPRRRVMEYLGCAPPEVPWGTLRAVQMSQAELAVAPLQDALGLGSEARMNRPGNAEGNWEWRALPEELSPGLASRLRALAEEGGRRSR